MDFNCRCGKCGLGRKNMNTNFLQKLEQIEKIYGAKLTITSGVRCEYYNDVILKASKTSSHKKGTAADIYISGSRMRFILINLCIDAGISRIGVGKDFIHIDDDKNKATAVMWIYG